MINFYFFSNMAKMPHPLLFGSIIYKFEYAVRFIDIFWWHFSANASLAMFILFWNHGLYSRVLSS